jgi:hypothetical protein
MRRRGAFSLYWDPNAFILNPHFFHLDTLFGFTYIFQFDLKFKNLLYRTHIHGH